MLPGGRDNSKEGNRRRQTVLCVILQELLPHSLHTARGTGDSVCGEWDDFNFACRIGPMVAQLYCLVILEPPVRTVEVLSAEDSPPPTIGLIRDTTGLVAGVMSSTIAFAWALAASFGDCEGLCPRVQC